MWSLLPSALQRSRTDHVPVLADEVRGLLAVTPGETVVDATFGAGGHARVLAADLQGQGPLHRDRPRLDRAAVLRALRARGRRAGALPAGRALRRPLPARRKRRRGRRDPPRPRRLEHADRPARARLLVRGRRAARHAHGSLRRAERQGDRQRVGRARARDDLPPLRRGALRAPDRPGDRSPARRSSPSSARASSSTSSSRPSPHRAASATAIPRSASSRRCGSPSTRSSTRSSARCRPRSRCCGRAAGSRSSASTRSRTVWSSAFSPPRHAGARARPSFPSASAETSRRCAS